jgi:uncharacterized protein YggE
MKVMAILLGLIILTLSGASEDVSTLKVLGEGKVVVPADTVFVTISVTTEDDNLSEASIENVEAMNRTIEALIGVGITREDVQSGRGRSVQSIQTKSRVCNNTTCVIVANDAVNLVKEQVVIRFDADDEDLINRTIKAATAEGAEAEISGYDLADAAEAVAEARQKAIDDAEDSARDIASVAGLVLGERLEIFEPSRPQILQQPAIFDPLDMMYIFDLSWAGMLEPIDMECSPEPGMMEVRSQIWVTYEVSS